MWDRGILKDRAKQELKVSYWLSFAVCLVAGIIAGSVSTVTSQITSAGSGFDANSFANQFNGYSEYGSSFGSTAGSSVSMIFLPVLIVSSLLGIAFFIFVANPIIVGKTTFFIRAPYGQRDFSFLFSVFKNGRYANTVKTMFMVNLRVFLWSLLCIIPGIVVSYQYFFVPYIISDFPQMPYKDAMEYSKRMTDGHKFDIFVLQLSFIGWYLLGLLACCIGAVFVNPYLEATMAQLYIGVRNQFWGENEPNFQIPPPGYIPVQQMYNGPNQPPMYNGQNQPPVYNGQNQPPMYYNGQNQPPVNNNQPYVDPSVFNPQMSQNYEQADVGQYQPPVNPMPVNNMNADERLSDIPAAGLDETAQSAEQVNPQAQEEEPKE